MADEYLERARGIPLGTTHSGYAAIYLEGERVLTGEPQKWLRRQIEQSGPVIVFPMRCPDSGIVRAFQIRPAKPPKGYEGPKCLHRFPQKSEAGAPYLFGQVKGLIGREWHENVNTVVLCEGSIDTFTAESFAASDGTVFAIGSAGAGELVTAAKYLASRKDFTARVVIVYDLENAKPKEKRMGRNKAREANQILRDAGKASEMFDWATYIRALNALGVSGEALNPLPDDLNESLTRALDAGVQHHRIARAFLSALEEE